MPFYPARLVTIKVRWAPAFEPKEPAKVFIKVRETGRMSGEIRRKHCDPGMMGADVIRAAADDRCPACGALLDSDGRHHGRGGEVMWFASYLAPRRP